MCTSTRFAFHGWAERLLRAFLPAGLIAEYHHHAKATARAIWPVSLASEAYGDCYRNYVAIDEFFKQGGYETQPC
jgi:hypothetical protein